MLVSRGLAVSRTAAQHLIDTGRVYHGPANQRHRVGKPSAKLDDDVELYVEPHADDRFVSRGGLKLAGALAEVGLDVQGWRALDVGMSTGGFTDCLLQHGAAQVTGLDVGQGQLHSQLRADARVTAHEKVNARDPEALAAVLKEAFDLLVGDLSFISQTLVLPAVLAWLKPGGQVLMLVKPQFELQPAQIGKGGIVRDPALYAEVEQRLRQCCADQQVEVLQWLDSPIAGGDGNREFFVQARRA